MEVLRFSIIGLATGGLFALLAQGLVLIYRGSGLLNFAQGAIAMMGGYAYYEATVGLGAPRLVGFVVAVAFCALLGVAIHYGIMRPMRHSSALQRVIATLGVLMVLQSFAYLRYGFHPLKVPSLFPTDSITLFHDDLRIGVDRLAIIVLCLVVSVALYLGYRRSAFGRATTAVAENQLAASSFGISPDSVAAMNWALSSALAGVVGVLIAPIVFLEPATLVLLIIPAMSAALIGNFMSFPLTLATALVLGVLQGIIQRYVDQPGWATASPFLLVVVILLIQGKSLPLRSFVLDKLPSIGSGRVRPVPAAVLIAGVALLTLSMGPNWATAMISTVSMAVICLSVIVVTGYTGQLSLAQASLAGLGALITARLAFHLPFVLAVVVGATATAVVGLVISVPALRTRGITLAVVTLGLGGALTDLVLNHHELTGGLEGLTPPVPTLFGWSIDPLMFPERYATFAFVTLVAVALAVANLRRGRVGRRMLAVRSNERAAASLGVNVPAVKSYAFTLSAAIAALGGTLHAFAQPTIEMSSFTLFIGIVIVAVTVVGGVGYVPGALLGSLMMTGGLAAQLFEGWPEVNDYMPLIGGVILVLTLIAGPDGLFEMNRHLLAQLPWHRVLPWARPPKTTLIENEPVSEPVRVPRRELVVEDLSVSFGGVKAVQGVSISIKPGEIHGVIGPNGAGKTTLIDGITGFVSTRSGSVRLDDRELSSLKTRKRSQAGLSRSFQSLELFASLTVRENLAIAGERPGWSRYLSDLLAPGKVELSSAAWEAVRQFDLTDIIDENPENTSFGHRKAVAIARAVASTPSVLLLDEPAAGLGDVEVAELAELISILARQWGIGIMLVEHNVDLVLSLCDRITVMQSGKVIMSGTPDEVRRSSLVKDAYLGAR